MNPRIRELAEQAGFNLIQHGDHVIYDISTKENMSEFTRLIVGECIQQVNEAIPETDCSSSGAYRTARIACTARIAKHFGVE